MTTRFQACHYCHREARFTSLDERHYIQVICGECELSKSMLRIRAVAPVVKQVKEPAAKDWWQQAELIKARPSDGAARYRAVELFHQVGECEYCAGDLDRVGSCPKIFEEVVVTETAVLDQLVLKARELETGGTELFTNGKKGDTVDQIPREVTRMPRVQTGFGNLQKRQEQESKNRLTGDFINYLRLGDDGDMARFRILSAHEDEYMATSGVPSSIVSASFHRVEQYSKAGKRFFSNILCGKEEDEDGALNGECKYCEGELGRRVMFMVWIYLYDYYHRRQSADLAKPWTQVQIGQMTLYREPINRYVIWQDNYFAQQQLEGRLSRYGNINDRDYDRTRRGVKGDTQVRYELEGLEPSVMDAKVKAGAQNLPDLYKIAMGEVQTLDGRSGLPAQAGETPADAPTQHREVQVPGDSAGSENLYDLPF